jgi:hypothetical protein
MVGSIGYCDGKGRAKAHAVFCALDPNAVVTISVHGLTSFVDVYLGPIYRAERNAMAGRPEQAHKAVARLRQLNPALRVSSLKDVLGPYRHAEDLSRYEEGLRQAGLPE